MFSTMPAAKKKTTTPKTAAKPKAKASPAKAKDVAAAAPSSAWGPEATRFFYDLTPERMLDAVEKFGVRCTGRCLPLNSMENRVYELEVDVKGEVKSASDAFRVAKFYRPGRWTREQILEEHQFLADLTAADVPVIPPLTVPKSKETLLAMEETGIFFTLFLKSGGRNVDEPNVEQLKQIGRTLARLHNAGAAQKTRHRVALNVETYGFGSLDYLFDHYILPPEIEDHYADVVEAICEISQPWFEETAMQRIHGDCHLGNVLWNDAGPVLVDFDDMVSGPCIQDLWLVVPGRDADSRERFKVMTEAYGSLSRFDPAWLRLVEPLRALRNIHFSAWISKRWEDPAFQRKFDYFGSASYWRDELASLEECLRLMEE
jgi:Ser/Thr protein kinase RdoA (MazF antagonist)